MSTTAFPRQYFGNNTAEGDTKLLEKAFFPTPEFHSIVSSPSSLVVVGRRGSGKSAIFQELQRRYSSDGSSLLIPLKPEQYDIYGIRSFLKLFGQNRAHLQAVAKLAWQYAILNQILSELYKHYKASNIAIYSKLAMYKNEWQIHGDSIVQRLYQSTKKFRDVESDPEGYIAEYANYTMNNQLLELVEEAIDSMDVNIQVLVDNLDEGYEPDDMGVSLMIGLLHALDKLNSKLNGFYATIMLRDNIFRSIQIHDQDYTRNIEGNVIRVHWDDELLFAMICERIRNIRQLEIENNVKTWNTITSEKLNGMKGFRKCLRITLYRPRDIIALLNTAYYQASRDERTRIGDSDVQYAAVNISDVRLQDTIKEYIRIMPGIDKWLRLFENQYSKLTHAEIILILEGIDKCDLDPDENMHHNLLSFPNDHIRTLYSIGYIGIFNSNSGTYMFCHDGKRPKLSITDESIYLIHPCYWIAQDIKESELSTKSAESIYDEYDIAVVSEAIAIRKHAIDDLCDQLKEIDCDIHHAKKFENWCLNILRRLFSNTLSNFEIQTYQTEEMSNIVARNTMRTAFWESLYQKHDTRQVIFGIVNTDQVLLEGQYMDVQKRMTNDQGRLAFIINQSTTDDIRIGKELDIVRDIYKRTGIVIVKLPAFRMVKWLKKLKDPRKHDLVGMNVNKLIRNYYQKYLK